MGSWPFNCGPRKHNFAKFTEADKQVNRHFGHSWSLKILVLPSTKINTP